MSVLYDLTFYSSPNEDDREHFHIGVFKSYEDAKSIEVYYKKEVTGFKDYDDCVACIKEVPLIGEYENQDIVYSYTGWNVDDDYDEINILESDYFISKEEAKRKYLAL